MRSPFRFREVTEQADRTLVTIMDATGATADSVDHTLFVVRVAALVVAGSALAVALVVVGRAG